ncbi:MAG: hypothetical protein H6R11_159 [Proteobacteria bacterium]|nr:hypothetical protein [Pseudomonadota bacterium]
MSPVKDMWRFPSYRSVLLRLGIGAASTLGWLAPGAAAAAEPGSTAVAADCQSLPPALAREVEAWSTEARAAKAGTAAAAAPAIDPGRKYHISLASDAELTLRISPQRAMNPPAGFGGYVALQAGLAGAYRVSLDERAWIELVAEPTGRAAVVTHSDKRLRCAGIVKNLSFELAAGTRYWVQLSGAGRDTLDLMVSPPAE